MNITISYMCVCTSKQNCCNKIVKLNCKLNIITIPKLNYHYHCHEHKYGDMLHCTTKNR